MRALLHKLLAGLALLPFLLILVLILLVLLAPGNWTAAGLL